MSTKTQAKPLFAATLTPHRSLTPVGKRVVIGLAVALVLAPSAIFYLLGAWPAVAFMAADVLALFAALTLSMRAGRVQEVLTLWPAALELRKIAARGVEDLLKFTPAAVRFVIDRDFNERVTALWLKSDGKKVPLGSFLSPDEKLSLSKAFGTALRKARH